MSKLKLTAAGFAACIATGAIAQSSSPGFFPPTPDGDVALTKIVPPRAEPAPQVLPPQVTAAQVERNEIEREAALRKSEEDLARAEREAAAERARVQATPSAPIVGAFTGLTSERDR